MIKPNSSKGINHSESLAGNSQIFEKSEFKIDWQKIQVHRENAASPEKVNNPLSKVENAAGK